MQAGEIAEAPPAADEARRFRGSAPNTIEHAVILSETDLIEPDCLALHIPGKSHAPSMPELKENEGLKELLEQTELKYLNMYYEKYGNIRAAASRLKMSPTTFLRHKTELENKYGEI